MIKAYPFRAIALAALMSVAPMSTALAGKADNTLNVSFSEEILELDYNYTTKREYIIISDLIDDTLFSVDPETNEYLPALASGYEYVDDRTIDSHIKRLRKKFKVVDDDFQEIETLYGVGYRYREG